MRLPAALLLISAAAGLLSVAVLAEPISTQCALVALAGLVGYLVVAGRGAPPRVRWALAAGVGLLGVAAAVRLFWSPAAGDLGWLGYGPVSSATLAGTLRQIIGRDQLTAAVMLLGVLCLAVAVFALPRRRRPGRAVTGAVLALLLLAALGADVGSRTASAPPLRLMGAGWAALLATVVAAGIAVLRAGGR